ncbi:MAG: hypothetical protein IJ552_07515 [Prevotella sp.]|nr:hypothetical protein [Prevotella sp.]
MKYYHVTQKKNLESILKNGLKKGKTAQKLSAGVFLFRPSEKSSLTLADTARLLAKQLKPQHSPKEFSETYVLLEVDSTGIDDQIHIDPFMRTNLKWYDINWYQYEVEIETISPDHLTVIEEFEVLQKMSDQSELLGYLFTNMADFMFIEAVKRITAYIEDGTLEKALRTDYYGTLKKQILEVREKVLKLMPDDPILCKLSDIQALSEIAKAGNNKSDMSLTDLMNSTIKEQINNNVNDQLQAFLKHIGNEDCWKNVHHGLQHWKQVERLGVFMSRLTEGTDEDVIRWFAYLHDIKRVSDGRDYNHGEKAAKYIDTIRKSYLKDLDDKQIEKLKTACAQHTTTNKTDDPTINICFDADRLDLSRVGTIIVPSRLATAIGRKLSELSYKYMSELIDQKVGKYCLK